MPTNPLRSLVTSPWVYNRVQEVFGLKLTMERMAPYFHRLDKQSILDVGAGTGLYLPLIPSEAQYIWLDPDPRKYDGFKIKNASGHWAVLGTGEVIPLRSKSVDVAMCVAVSHHLDDNNLAQMFAEISRVVCEGFFFLDAIRTSRITDLLWKMDRGSFPRSEDEIRNQLSQHFTVSQWERYAHLHCYVQAWCVPL